MISPYNVLPKNKVKLIGFVSFACLIAFWWLITSLNVIDPNKLPSPSKVIHAFSYLAWDNGHSLLLNAILASLSRVAIASLCIIIIGIPVGILMGSSQYVNSVIGPIIDPFRSAPISALLPLFVMWFGIGEQMKITFLIVAGIVYLIPLVRDSITSVPYSYWETLKDLGATDTEAIFHSVLPLSAPRIFDGIIVSISIVWTYIVVAEYVNADSGLGELIQNARRFSAIDQVFVGIFTIMALALITNTILMYIKKKVYFWEGTSQ